MAILIRGIFSPLYLTDVEWVYQFCFNAPNDIIHVIFTSFNSLWPQFSMEAWACWRRCGCSCHHMNCECPPISCALHASNSNNILLWFWDLCSLFAPMPCLVRQNWTMTPTTMLKQSELYSQWTLDALLGRSLAAPSYPLVNCSPSKVV